MIASSLAAVDELITWCSFRHGQPPLRRPPAHAALERGEWVLCSDALADELFFPTWHALLARRLAGQYGSAPAQTPPGYVMSWYAGLFGYLGGALFHLARRVPSLAPQDIAFRLDTRLRRPAEVALLASSFACLPGDPAIHRDSAPAEGTEIAELTVVPDEQSLAAVLRARVAAHGERFVTAFQPSARFGRRTLWGTVTDSLDGGLLYAGRARGEPAAGAADAALVLPSRIPPFTSASTVRHIQGHWTRERQSCCFHYKLPGVERPCATCPRLSDLQRTRLLND